MALIRVAQYSSTPGPVTDYQAQNAHLQAFTNQLMTQQFILDSGTAKPVIKQGCYVSHGGSLYIADADTPITGSPSDGSVYIRVSGTTSLTVEFVTDISGYTWNPVYTALTSGSYTLLPYLLIKASSVWGRYNLNANAQAFGDPILDKNGREVLALNIEQQTDSYSVTSATANNTFTFTFGGNVKGIVWLDIVLTIDDVATKSTYNYVTLKTTTISTNTVSVVAEGIKGGTVTTGVIKVYITCATD